jgi:two-component system chemotaxis response regulator CheB
MFTTLLAERLNGCCQLTVKEAADGDRVEPGRILVAPGGLHLKVVSEGGEVRARLDESPPQNSCRPAVDALFTSVGEIYGGAAIAVILTGMGRDGLRGVELLQAQGANVIVQDEDSSVVWGMPGVVAKAGLADQVVPLDQVVPRILQIVGQN